MKIYSHKKGMTLVEALVLIVMFTILMLVIIQSVVTFYEVHRSNLQQALQIDNARRGTEIFTKDVREATYGDEGSYPLAIIDPHHIGFYSDINGDDNVEYIEYELVASTTLKKRIFNATGSPPVYSTAPDNVEILSKYVQNFILGTSTFQYYDASGAEVTNPSDITDVRYVTARLIVDVDPGVKPRAFTLYASAAIRNLNTSL